MTMIIGISGKKESGKTTFSNYITGLAMVSLKMIPEFNISEEGHLLIGQETLSVDEVFKRDSRHPLVDLLGPHLKVYNYAEALKRSVCMDVLGLDEDCFSREGKNRPTKYKWKDFRKFLSQETKKLAQNRDDELMTNREIMQVVGTDIFRTIDTDVWVKSCLRRIEREAPKVAIINDVRFVNEVEGIQQKGGHVIRLLRQVEADSHSSENVLDNYEKFDTVIDNNVLTLEQTAEKVFNLVKELSLFNE
jgi:hypothetical protein